MRKNFVKINLFIVVLAIALVVLTAYLRPPLIVPEGENFFKYEYGFPAYTYLCTYYGSEKLGGYVLATTAMQNIVFFYGILTAGYLAWIEIRKKLFPSKKRK